jgi:hypothetical protein
MKKLFTWIVTLTLLTILLVTSAGCAGGAEPAGEPGRVTVPGAIPAPTVISTESSSFFLGKGEDQGAASYAYDNDEVNNIDRIIIRSGDISLIVADVAQTQEDIKVLTSSLDGYVVSSNIWVKRKTPAAVSVSACPLKASIRLWTCFPSWQSTYAPRAVTPKTLPRNTWTWNPA